MGAQIHVAFMGQRLSPGAQHLKGLLGNTPVNTPPSRMHHCKASPRLHNNHRHAIREAQQRGHLRAIHHHPIRPFKSLLSNLGDVSGMGALHNSGAMDLLRLNKQALLCAKGGTQQGFVAGDARFVIPNKGTQVQGVKGRARHSPIPGGKSNPHSGSGKEGLVGVCPYI